MTESKLVELSYYDPKAQTRLTAYADTIILDRNEKGGIISAIRFGGYPEVVRALADAIYGGATIEATQNNATHRLQSNLKGYQWQLTHDGVYATATLMASDNLLSGRIYLHRRRSRSVGKGCCADITGDCGRRRT